MSFLPINENRKLNFSNILHFIQLPTSVNYRQRVGLYDTHPNVDLTLSYAISEDYPLTAWVGVYVCISVMRIFLVHASRPIT